MCCRRPIAPPTCSGKQPTDFGNFFRLRLRSRRRCRRCCYCWVHCHLFRCSDKLPGEASFFRVPILVFLSLAIYSRMNIGLRHILPIYPFLFVWLGGVSAALLRSPSIAKRGAVCFLGLWLVGSCVVNYPDYLAFFNETLGDRERHEILVDSNLDWGQDLKGLKRWMVDQGVEKIELAYFGTADPAYYGIKAIYEPGTWSAILSEPPDSTRLRTAPYIAISATHLVGLYFAPA